MGITISTTATSPFFLTTGIIGLLSFAFTLATFLRVTHQNISTLLSAPHEVHSYLTNLRQELLEERTSLKFLRKACKTRRKQHSRAMEDYLDLQLDTATIKTMTDAVRQMIKQFQTLEKPFLEAGEEGIGQVVRRRSRSRRSPYYPHEAYNSPPYEKRAEEEDDDEVFWPEARKVLRFHATATPAVVAPEESGAGVVRAVKSGADEKDCEAGGRGCVDDGGLCWDGGEGGGVCVGD
jgi:hypothetical protein